MDLSEGAYKTLATICGGIYHSLIKHNQRTISKYETEQLNWVLRLDKAATFSDIETTGTNRVRFENDFVLVEYIHSDFLSERQVKVTFKRRP